MTFKRYERNIMLPNFGVENQKKIINAKVLVCGAGGLGSNVILNLCAMGIGNIGIVDCDNVELSNLNRQYIHTLDFLDKPKVDSAKSWVQKFNPEIYVKIFKLRLDESNYKSFIDDFDIIVDCFDSLTSKFILNKIAIETGKPVVHASALEFQGQLTTISIQHHTGCLNCILSNNFDSKKDLPTKGVLSPIVATMGSMQALEVAKNITGIASPLYNRFLIYDGLNLKFKILEFTRNPNCQVCNIID